MESIATWVAPVATTIAALMTASNLGSRITGYGFIVFTVGSLAWLTLGITTGQANLLWQNVILTALNLFGIWRWLGRQAKIEDGGSTAQAESKDMASETLFPASMFAKAKVVGAGGAELGASVEAMLGCRSGARPMLSSPRAAWQGSARRCAGSSGPMRGSMATASSPRSAPANSSAPPN